jgi:hypothetical protein
MHNMSVIEPIIKSKDFRRIPFESPILVAHQPEFLPWLGFVSKAAMGDIFVLLDSVDFRKEYFQNRNKIRMNSQKGWQWLTVPVARAKTHSCKICEACIERGRWITKHLRAIEQSYSKTQYFSEIYPELQAIYDYKGNNLSEFNTKFIRFALRMFKIQVPIYRTSEMVRSGYDISGEKTDIVISMCQAVSARTFVAGQFGKTYLEIEKFRKLNIKLVFQSFTHPVYKQIHGGFVENMSYIDLLFNHGPDSVNILGKSAYDQS